MHAGHPTFCSEFVASHGSQRCICRRTTWRGSRSWVLGTGRRRLCQQPILKKRGETLRATTGGDEVRLRTEEEEEELDELVKAEFGVDRFDQLTDIQKKYKDKIAAKLAEEKERERKALEARSRDFNIGKYLYERGQYPEAAAAFTKALDAEGPFSQLGGEVQLWLALAYQACGKEQECIDLYKAVEGTHPNPSIKRQAANLRFILEAPKLKLGPDERVSVPVLKGEAVTRSPRKSFGRVKVPAGGRSERPKTFEEKFMEEYTPPNLIPNKYVAVAAAVLAIGLACYSAYVSKL